LIEVKGVSKAYGSGQNLFMVLDNVSFTIPDGASVAIVGKSGSGKSSLVHVMSGLSRPDIGQVLIDGSDILRMSQKEIDRFRLTTMGFIFQSFYIQSTQSCAKNVGLPLEILGVPRRKRGAMVDEALRAVGLYEKKHVKARNLSGGQKQRLAIARSIVNRPRILFADEPTGNLDVVTGQAIERLLFWCNAKLGTTLIIVTHDQELANGCDIQVEISDGRVVAVKEKGQSASTPQQAIAKENFAKMAQNTDGEKSELVDIDIPKNSSEDAQ
jgi:putative ABC transport system ATP-binding protein